MNWRNSLISQSFVFVIVKFAEYLKIFRRGISYRCRDLGFTQMSFEILRYYYSDNRQIV